MKPVDPLNSSLYFSAAAAAATNQANQAKKKSETEKEKKVQGRQFFDVLKNTAVNETEDFGFPPEIARLPYDEALQVLLDTVYSSGDVLKKSQDKETVMAYKKAVKNFMSFVVKNSYEVEKSESARTLQKRRKYYQIQVIDQKLDQLATGVLFNQRDQMALLGKIEEINGLLIDLTR